MKYVDENIKILVQFFNSRLSTQYHIFITLTRAPAIITIINTITLNSNNNRCF